jgi:hypothetical protein
MKHLHPADASLERLPRGNYVAHVTDSDIQDGWVELRLTCAGYGRMWKTRALFRVVQPDLELQHRERYRLHRVASAVGLKEFNDTDQLHGIPFRMIVWGDGKLEDTFRPYRRTEDQGLAKIPGEFRNA